MISLFVSLVSGVGFFGALITERLIGRALGDIDLGGLGLIVLALFVLIEEMVKLLPIYLLRRYKAISLEEVVKFALLSAFIFAVVEDVGYQLAYISWWRPLLGDHLHIVATFIGVFFYIRNKPLWGLFLATLAHVAFNYWVMSVTSYWGPLVAVNLSFMALYFISLKSKPLAVR